MSDFPPPPSQPEQNPYGAPSYPSGPPQYGQNPYPMSGQEWNAQPQKRPGTVTAASVITIVLSVLAALGGVVFAIIGFALDVADLPAEVSDELEANDISTEDFDMVLSVLGWFGVAMVVLSVLAIVLAVLVLRRSNAARIILTVLSGLTAIAALISVTSGLSALWLVGGVLVIVFMFTKAANAWFRSPTY